MEKVKFDMVYAFKYSPREGTPAAKMQDQVEASIKEERINTLLAIQDKISLSKNNEYIGQKVRVLVDSQSKRRNFNTLSARTESNKLVHFASDEDIIGEFRYVEIEKAGAYDLAGKLIENK